MINNHNINTTRESITKKVVNVYRHRTSKGFGCLSKHSFDRKLPPIYYYDDDSIPISIYIYILLRYEDDRIPIYIYIYTHIHVYVCIHIYACIERERER